MTKGYVSSRKTSASGSLLHPTVEPVRLEQNALSVLAHLFVRLVASDTAEAGSGSLDSQVVDSIYKIVATAHVAHVGDIIRVTSGAYSGYESKVISTDTNDIFLADAVSLSVGNTFEIHRHTYPAVNASGSLSISVTPSPIEYVLNGVDTEVEESTGTPLNSRPLPVKVLDAAGLVVGFSTAAKQDTQTARLDSILLDTADIETAVESIDVKLPSTLGQKAMAASLAVVLASDQSAIPVSQSGAWSTGRTWALTSGTDSIAAAQSGAWSITDISGTISLPTGAATQATLAALNAKFSALGQTVMASSVPVVIASNQSAISVAQSGSWSQSILSSTLEITGSGGSLNADAIASTDVSAYREISLQVTVTGTNTTTFQGSNDNITFFSVEATVHNSNTTAAQTTTTSSNLFRIPITFKYFRARVTSYTSGSSAAVAECFSIPSGNDIGMRSVNVNNSTLAVTQSGTWNITNVSGTVSLPTGASTETTLSAVSGKLPATLGQKAMAASMAVVVASDQSNVPISQGGRSYADSVVKNSGTVTSGAWVQLIASTAAIANAITLFDSSGFSWELGFGAAASEARKLIVPPGGFNGAIPLLIPAGTRLSARAINTTADYTSAELLLTLLS